MTLGGWNSEGWPGSSAFALASCDAGHVAVRRAYVRHDYAFTPLSASILASSLVSPSLYTPLPPRPPSPVVPRSIVPYTIPLFLFFLLLFRLLSSREPLPVTALSNFSRMFLIMPELVPLWRTLSRILSQIECRALKRGSTRSDLRDLEELRFSRVAMYFITDKNAWYCLKDGIFSQTLSKDCFTNRTTFFVRISG